MLNVIDGIKNSLDNIAAVVAHANELRLSREAVEEIRTNLVNAQDVLTEFGPQMATVPASSTGGSYWGHQVAHHASQVKTALQDLMAGIVQGLDAYEAGMTQTWNDAAGVDEDVVATLATAETYTASVPGPA